MKTFWSELENREPKKKKPASYYRGYYYKILRERSKAKPLPFESLVKIDWELVKRLNSPEPVYEEKIF
jgi:hypothetical protein